MGRKTLALLVLALAIPGAALAAKPSTPTSHSKANPVVMYVLKGTLSNFTAASSTANGSVTINVTRTNHPARALKGIALTFAVATSTSTTLDNGTISNGARGIVKFRAPLRATSSGLLTTLAPNQMTAVQVIAQG